MEFQKIFIHSFRTGNNNRPATLRERLNMRIHCGPYEWIPTKAGKGRGFYQASNGLKIGDATFRLRLVEANELLPTGARLRHVNGYYADAFQDTTLTPIVARLPHGRGYLAGWTMGAGMCGSIGPNIYQDAEQCARAAHHEAEWQAEKERETEEQTQARIDAEFQDEDIEEELG